MTTETERRVPEHPGWQPWWLRYAAYEGRKVVLSEASRIPERHLAHLSVVHEYMMFDPDGLFPCPSCGWELGAIAGRLYALFDSLADAEAAFELACERLREGV